MYLLVTEFLPPATMINLLQCASVLRCFIAQIQPTDNVCLRSAQYKQVCTNILSGYLTKYSTKTFIENGPFLYKMMKTVEQKNKSSKLLFYNMMRKLIVVDNHITANVNKRARQGPKSTILCQRSRTDLARQEMLLGPKL